MTSHVIAVAVDCRDAEAQASFWCHALGQQVLRRWEDAASTPYVEVGDDVGPVLLFQPVPERKGGKNRLHLDLAPTTGTQADEVARLTDLGATLVADDPDFPWVVLHDPEGNEFCVLPPRRQGENRGS